MRQAKAIVRQVLSEAADAPHFFELSDAQRLNWMIGRAYELGKKKRSGKAPPVPKMRRRARQNCNRERSTVSILVKAQ